MIIVKLMGGLGNQMFQYAAGRQVAEKHGVPLKMDLSFLNDRTPQPDFTFRDYQLNVFRIAEHFATDEEVKLFKQTKPKKIIPKLIYKTRRVLNPVAYIKEKHYHFDPEISRVPSKAYLEGFWQTEKYFRNIEGILRREFELKFPPAAGVAESLEKIKSLNAVSIHVRRGDYVANKTNSDYHGVCPPEYYEDAVKYLADRVVGAHFFIFSDEIQWARENLRIDHPHTFMEKDRSLPDYEDLRLMSACRYNIIANSSFSWWAAWLNNHRDKIVIAPKKWFKNPAINTDDLIPETWIKI